MDSSVFIEWAEAKSWNIESSSDTDLVLPEVVVSRYSNIPREYISFLAKFKMLASPDDQTWFLSIDDFNGSSSSEFRWNELESLSLEEANGGDSWVEEIKLFWDMHFPIAISVRGEYGYFAINMKNLAVVESYAPYLEEPSMVANDFVCFLELIMKGEIEF